MNELLEALKKNKMAFCKMSGKMQDAAKELGKNGNFLYLDESGHFIELHGESDNYIFTPNRTYRLRPDYQEEAEVEKVAVYESGSMGSLTYKRGNEKPWNLQTAAADPDFIGFLYEDGSVRPYGRVYKYGPNFYSVLTEKEIASGKWEVLTPTHVLFRKAK